MYSNCKNSKFLLIPLTSRAEVKMPIIDYICENLGIMRKSLNWIIALACLVAVESVEPVFGAYPDESGLILGNADDRRRREPVGRTVVGDIG